MGVSYLLAHSQYLIKEIKLMNEYNNPKSFFKRSPFGNGIFMEEKCLSNVMVVKINLNSMI